MNIVAGDKAPHNYLALGDSYTIGEGVAVSARWPVQLTASLRQRNIALSEPRIIAQTGWTTTDLDAALELADPPGPYQLVTLLIGVNNQFQGLSPGDYREDLTRLIERAIELASGQPQRLLIVSIPDWSVMPFAIGLNRQRIAAEIDRLNRIKREAAARAGVRYIDVTGISRQAAHDMALIADDDLHPSGKMYALWVAAIVPFAEAILTGDETP